VRWACRCPAMAVPITATTRAALLPLHRPSPWTPWLQVCFSSLYFPFLYHSESKSSQGSHERSQFMLWGVETHPGSSFWRRLWSPLQFLHFGQLGHVRNAAYFSEISLRGVGNDVYAGPCAENNLGCDFPPCRGNGVGRWLW
jgi:hypothetical protein